MIFKCDEHELHSFNHVVVMQTDLYGTWQDQDSEGAKGGRGHRKHPGDRGEAMLLTQHMAADFPNPR